MVRSRLAARLRLGGPIGPSSREAARVVAGQLGEDLVGARQIGRRGGQREPGALEAERHRGGTAARGLGAAERVGDARALGDAEEPRSTHRPDDVDDELRRGVNPSVRVETRKRHGLRRPLTRTDAGQPGAGDGQQRKQRHEEQRDLRPRQIDHPSSVAPNLSQLCADFVPDV